MHSPDLPHQIPPLLYQGGDLLGFHGNLPGNAFEQGDLAIHNPERVLVRHCSAIDHGPVGMGLLAGLDDAGVGFGGGHGGIVP